MPSERRFQQIRTIVRYDDEVLLQTIGQTRRPRINRRRFLRPEAIGGRADGVHDLIVITVEIALELEEFGSAGEGAGQPQAMQRRFRARAGETDALAAGDRLAQAGGPSCVCSSFS